MINVLLKQDDAPPPFLPKKKKKKVSHGRRGGEPAVRCRRCRNEAMPGSRPVRGLLWSSLADVGREQVNKTTYKSTGKFLDGHHILKGTEFFFFFFSKSFHFLYMAEGSKDLKTTPPWPRGGGKPPPTPWRSKAPLPTGCGPGHLTPSLR